MKPLSKEQYQQLEDAVCQSIELMAFYHQQGKIKLLEAKFNEAWQNGIELRQMAKRMNLDYMELKKSFNTFIQQSKERSEL